MKATFVIGLATVMLLPARAQLFGPDSLTGAAIGGIAGGIIGHNSGRKTAEGAAIGAGAGLLLGAAVGDARRERAYYATQPPVPSAPPRAYYGPTYRRPDYAVTGTVLGGVAGGVIGHNQGRHTAEGVAIGAGTGLLLGSLAEQNARRNEVVAYAPSVPLYVSPQQAPVQVVAPDASAQPAAPQSVTVINNYYGSSSSMSSANSLFGR